MLVHLSLNDLIDYTDWERQKWHAWFGQHGAHVLKISAGPHGYGRFEIVGELVRHTSPPKSVTLKGFLVDP